MNETIFELPERPITIVISDLHIGGGQSDKGDDHVHHGQSFIHFLNRLSEIVNAEAHKILLVINGDFLEFAQTAPEKFDDTIAYGNWCCEQESLDKVKVIIQGNLQIWEAMRAFQQQGGCIVINLGNHDIDFTWPKVRDAFTLVAGYATKTSEEGIQVSDSLIYALGQDWLSAYEGKLLITHGNQFDPANKFEHWHNPIVGYTPERLEMCAGTMFMIKFVNHMEAEYPFADNITPITRLYYILRDQDPEGLSVLRWLLGIFLAKHPIHSIGIPANTYDYQLDKMLRRYQTDNNFKLSINTAVTNFLEKESLPKLWDQDRDTFNAVIIRLLACMPKSQIIGLLLKDSGNVGIARSAMADDIKLQDEAQKALIKFNAEIVIMGHTHQPDEYHFDFGDYFNPGSWTRYWNINDQPQLTLEELRDDSHFPYELNFIMMKQDTIGKLIGKKVTFEKS